MNRHLVIFLWITFFVEVIGAYAPIAYFSDYKYFSIVENTAFEDHKWLYNPYILYSYIFLPLYFVQLLRNQKWRFGLKAAIAVFGVSALLNLVFSGVYFESNALFTILVGTLLLIVCIILFYFELLQTDLILKLKKFLPMYISVGLMVFNLCVTPVDIFSEYFSEENTFFVKLHNAVYLYTNIFMYSLFAIGFIICSRKKTSS